MSDTATNATAKVSQTVFVGGVVDFVALQDKANVASLLATGAVGLYTQEDAVQATYYSGDLKSITETMADTGPGEAELNLQHAAYIADWFKSWWQSAWVNFGLAPDEINSIIDFTSSTWVSDFDATATEARRHGILTVSPIFSPNLGSWPLDSFITDPQYSEIRDAALLGGGLCIDSPPGYFFLRGSAYQNFVYQEIQWAQANHLKVTVIISPYNDNANFMYDAKAFVRLLQWNNATPSDWVVEDYNASDTDGIGSDTDPNSVAGVALWVAQNAQTVQMPAAMPSPTPTITLNSCSEIEESYYGSGVDVTETVSTTYLAGPIYVGVVNAKGNVESSYFTPVYLNNNGMATFSIHLDYSGDYVVAENNLSNPVVLEKSSPVTITEPPGTITLSAPGIVEEASVGAGVLVTETVATTYVSGLIYVGVVNANGNIESSSFIAVNLNSSGSATFQIHLAHSGDYIDAETSLSHPALLVSSAPVTITEPSPNISSATTSQFSVTNILCSTRSTFLGIGEPVTFSISFNQALSVKSNGNTPLLRLNNGGTATLVGNHDNVIDFSYKVQAGQDTTNLRAVGLVLNGAAVIAPNGASLKDTSLSGLAGSDTGVDVNTNPPVVIIGPGVTETLQAGETLYDEGYGNTLVLPASGPVMISGNSVNNADVFNLCAAMSNTNWNGSLNTIDNYLTASVSPNGQDLEVLLHPTGSADAIVLTTLIGDGLVAGAFQRFEHHAMLTVPASLSSATAPSPIFISGPGVTTTLTAGEILYDTAYGNTLLFPAKGSVTLSGNTVNNGDTFDLRAVMATTTWDGQSSDLGNYLTQTIVNGGEDLNIMLHPQGGVASQVLATLLNDGPATGAFTRFEQHAELSKLLVQAKPPVVIIGPGVTETLQAGETLYDEGYGNTLVLPASGPVMISGNSVNNADVFNLCAAMSNTNWNGSLNTIDNYLTASVSPNGQDLEVLLHPTGSADAIVLTTLIGDGLVAGAFQRFEHHAMLTVPASLSSATAPSPIFISGPGVTTTLTAGEILYDTAYGNTLLFPAKGSVTLSGNTVNNGDTFDLRAVMATTTWDGQSSDLGNYLTQTIVNGGEDLNIMLHPQGGVASQVLATLLNDGPATGAFTRFEQHALF